MALDARRRSSIFGKLIPVLGEDDANALMSEFPSVEADELVTKEFHRAETALLRGEFKQDIAELRSEVQKETAGLRAEMADRFHEQTVRLTATIAGATAVLGTLTAVF